MVILVRKLSVLSNYIFLRLVYLATSCPSDSVQPPHYVEVLVLYLGIEFGLDLQLVVFCHNGLFCIGLTLPCSFTNKGYSYSVDWE